MARKFSITLSGDAEKNAQGGLDLELVATGIGADAKGIDLIERLMGLWIKGARKQIQEGISPEYISYGGH